MALASIQISPQPPPPPTSVFVYRASLEPTASWIFVLANPTRVCTMVRFFSFSVSSDYRRECTSLSIVVGMCTTLPYGNFSCSCASGWEGANCESMINVCHNVTCLNQGVCRPLRLSSYECLCLSDYSGDHCEVRSTRTATLQVVARSFVSVAVTALVFVAGFIVTLDVLKYAFHIDPVQKERDELQEAKTPAKPRRLPVHLVQRFIYVPWLNLHWSHTRITIIFSRRSLSKTNTIYFLSIPFALLFTENIYDRCGFSW